MNPPAEPRRSATIVVLVLTLLLTGCSRWPGPSSAPTAPAAVDLARDPALVGWRQAVEQAAEARVTAVYLGDSTVAGAGATRLDRTLPARLARRLGGSPTPIGQYVPVHPMPARDLPGPWAITGGRPAHGWGLSRQAWRWQGPGHASITLPSATSVEIHYAARSGDSFRYTVDAREPVTVRGTDGSDDGIETVDLGVRGPHRLEVSWRTGAPTVSGIRVYDGDEDSGVHVLGGGRGGTTSSYWATQPMLTRTTRRIAAIAEAEPRPLLVLLQLGANDQQHDIPSARYRANLERIIGAIRDAVPEATFALTDTWARGPRYEAERAETWESYVAAMREIADADAAVTLVPTGVPGVHRAPRGLYFTRIHLTDAGYARAAAGIAEALSPSDR